MTRPDAFHLPGFEASGGIRRRLAATEFEVPELDAAAVGQVWQRLDTAAAVWRRRTIAERVAFLAAVAGRLRAQGPGPWSEWLAGSTGLSAAGLAAAWEATFAPHDRLALEVAVAAEAGIEARAADDFARVVHVLSGNVLPPTFSMLLRGFLVGAAQWLRPASREPLFAACIAARLRDIAPELAAMCAVTWWPHGAAFETAVLAAAQIVTLQGDDAAVAALRQRLNAVAPQARFIGYGSRWSLGLLSRAAQTPENARHLAWDIALFDQQGCLSPSVVLAEDGPELAAWCGMLASELAVLEVRMPRGRPTEVGGASLRRWRERQRLGQALGDVRGLWESAGTSAWAVALLERGRWEMSPLDRHVPVLPFDSPRQIAAQLGARLASLQGIAVDLAGWDVASAASLIAALRPTRSVPPGILQAAPVGWMQDHHPPLASLLA